MFRPSPPTSGATLDEWLRWQERLHPQAIAMGLDRVRSVATRLGVPAAHIPSVVVAGTNGKGSSTILLAGIYTAAGYRVGAYTSPHLYRYNERIQIAGEPLADGALGTAFAAVEQARGDVPLTYFEFGTLAALWLFRAAAVDVQVLEVGLGGRLDAVNLVDGDVALVTNIGLDHMDWLGADREAIAREKAGIFRANRPAVYADDAPPPASLAGAAQALDAPLWRLGEHFQYARAGDAWSWRSPSQAYRKLPWPGLYGEAQLRNAAGVLAVVGLAQDRLPVPETAIRTALPRLRLAGRFERRGNMILDVAHNAEAAAALAENLERTALGPVILVLGMLADKPVERFCERLQPWVREAFFAGLPGPRGLTGPELAARAKTAGLEGDACADVATALQRARAAAGPADLILVCGSFLTVAAAGDVHG